MILFGCLLASIGPSLAPAARSETAPSPAGFQPPRLESDRALCRAALARVERQFAVVPDGFLVALGKVESDLWPWSLNVDGEPLHFPDRASAEAALREKLKTARSIDIGCGQVNARSHQAAIGHAALLLDPDINAAYAGWYLVDQWARCGRSWGCAGRRYYGSSNATDQAYRECRWAKAIAILQDRPAPDCQER